MIRGYTYVYYTYLYLFEKDMEARAQQSSLGSLTLAAIGVVYGDIGTSVLYAVKEVFG